MSHVAFSCFREEWFTTLTYSSSSSHNASLTAHKSWVELRDITSCIPCVSKNAFAADRAKRIPFLRPVTPFRNPFRYPWTPLIEFDRGANSWSVTSRCLRIKYYCSGQLDRTAIVLLSSATLNVQSSTWRKKRSVNNFCNWSDCMFVWKHQHRVILPIPWFESTIDRHLQKW